MSEVGGYTPTLLRNLRWTYAGWAGLVAAEIVLQFYLGGRAVFGLAFSGSGDFSAHVTNGFLIGLAILAGIGLAFLAQVPWRVSGINAALFVLVLLQPILAWTKASEVAALHVVNGGMIFAVTAYLVMTSITVARESRAGETGRGAGRGAETTPVGMGMGSDQATR